MEPDAAPVAVSATQPAATIRCDRALSGCEWRFAPEHEVVAGQRKAYPQRTVAGIPDWRLSVLFRFAQIPGDESGGSFRPGGDHGPVAGNALVSRPQAWLDRAQCGEWHDRRVHH